MADDKEFKRVIILDEKRKGNRPVDDEAAKRLLKELNREDPFADTDDEPDDNNAGEETEITEVTRLRIVRKKRLSKKNKLLIGLAASLIVLVIVSVMAIQAVNNNYRTPVRIYEEYCNKRSYDGEDRSTAYGNGVASEELKQLRMLLRRSDDYVKGLNESVMQSEMRYQDNCFKYGEDFRVRVTIEGTSPLSPAELNSCRAELSGIINDIGNSSLARSGNSDLTLAVTELTDVLGHPRITKGYRLRCVQSVTGSMLDGPASSVEYKDFTVVRLNGRWIMWDEIYEILRLSYI
ncbi:MAG: hypothetical protein K6E53_04355 [Lachnospiraceae bacterium]|nr:hypothetical protein [Lachnospiraceae bacterium]